MGFLQENVMNFFDTENAVQFDMENEVPGV